VGFTCNGELGNVYHDVNSVRLEEIAMGKLIIDNRSSVDRVVSNEGRQYQYATGGVRVMVVIDLNKCSDRDDKHRSE